MKYLLALTLSLTSLAGGAQAQSNWQRQQEVQRQQEMQRQQQMQQQEQQRRMQDEQRRQMQEQQRRQMQEEQRRQMQAQQRQQMQEQQRQQMQAQQRQQMQDQQRQQVQAQQRQQMTEQQRQQADQQQRQNAQRQGTLNKDGKQTGVVVSGGMPKMTRPLTPGEIQRGFTGRTTADGRALIKYQGRVFTVPASRVAGLSARLARQRADQQGGSGGARPPDGGSVIGERQGRAAQQQAAVSQRIARLASSGGGVRPPEGPSRTVANDNSPDSAQAILASARIRQASMLKDNVGFNISPISTDKFGTVGRSGTFVTDKKAMDVLLPPITAGQDRLRITTAEARRIEHHLGLQEGSLHQGFKVRRIENLDRLAPRSPVSYSENDKFRGAGQHLPSGHPELVVNSIATSGDPNVTSVIEVEVVQ